MIENSVSQGIEKLSKSKSQDFLQQAEALDLPDASPSKRPLLIHSSNTHSMLEFDKYSYRLPNLKSSTEKFPTISPPHIFSTDTSQACNRDTQEEKQRSSEILSRCDPPLSCFKPNDGKDVNTSLPFLSRRCESFKSINHVSNIIIGQPNQSKKLDYLTYSISYFFAIFAFQQIQVIFQMEILLQQEREKLAVMIKEISEGQTDSRLNGYKVSLRSSHYILKCK